MILKKNKYFWQVGFEKVFAHEKITFWFNLPRKMRKFRVLNAIIKSTFLKKINLLKASLWMKIILDCMSLNEKVFVKKLDFELKNFRLVRFRINFFTTRQILK